MPIQYVTSLDGITVDHLKGFFKGWPNPPSPERHLAMLRGSRHIVLAMDEDSRDVIGFVNAISDGSHFAFIPLLEVLPSYRGRGIGSELIRRLVAQLRAYYAIDLQCDEDLQAFYERLGFAPALGMRKRHYAQQADGRATT